eukprot:COSAG01_NODE_1685_length_9495_cov_61.609728_4_plen_504_part_00
MSQPPSVNSPPGVETSFWARTIGVAVLIFGAVLLALHAHEFSHHRVIGTLAPGNVTATGRAGTLVRLDGPLVGGDNADKLLTLDATGKANASNMHGAEVWVERLAAIKSNLTAQLAAMDAANKEGASKLQKAEDQVKQLAAEKSSLATRLQAYTDKGAGTTPAKLVPTRLPGTEHAAGILHRNCYSDKPDVADPFFNFFSSYKVSWINKWHQMRQPLRHIAVEVNQGNIKSGSDKSLLSATVSWKTPPRQRIRDQARVTFIVVSGFPDSSEPIGREAQTLVKSILLMSSVDIELIFFTNRAGATSFAKIFSEITVLRFALLVRIIEVDTALITATAKSMNYDGTNSHHSGIWGTLKLFVHAMPVFQQRRPQDVQVMIDTDMILMTDPAGLLSERPRDGDRWVWKMPLTPKPTSPSNVCSCIVVLNIRDGKLDLAPFQKALEQERDGRFKNHIDENGLKMYTAPHGDQGVLWSVWKNKQSQHMVTSLPQVWNLDLCHNFYGRMG